ncbi:hypothetical protein BD413DRAFT_279656 [Trametes elegans]|nr:hypothetical protein BD413DRAFT_279656 [Trametes elegans]
MLEDDSEYVNNFGGSLMRELESAASEVSENLALMEQFGQLHGSNSLSWPYFLKFSAIPNGQPNYSATFVAPIDPCSFDEDTARFLPQYMYADTILTARLVAAARRSVSPSASSWVDLPPGSEDDMGGADAASYQDQSRGEELYDRPPSSLGPSDESIEERSDDASGCGARPLCAGGLDAPDAYTDGQLGKTDAYSYERSLCESKYWNGGGESEDRSDPEGGSVDMLADGPMHGDDTDLPEHIRHMQVLAHSEDSAIDLALLCASSPKKLYHTIASSLLQRRILGIVDPMVGSVCGPGEYRLRIALSWTSVCGHGLLEVYVACGATTAPASRGLGMFNLRFSSSALAMGCTLVMLCDRTRDIVRRAQGNLPAALLRPALHWRLDLAGREHSDPDISTPRDRIEVWRAEVTCRSGRTLLFRLRIPNVLSSLLASDSTTATSMSRTALLKDGSIASGSSRASATSSRMPSRKWTERDGVKFKQPALRNNPKLLPLLFTYSQHEFHECLVNFGFNDKLSASEWIPLAIPVSQILKVFQVRRKKESTSIARQHSTSNHAFQPQHHPNLLSANRC